MSYHRLLEARKIDGRLRAADTLLDYRGAPVPFLEPLDAVEHGLWLATMSARAAPLRKAA